ncbi:MAG TPA: hypothetical protein VGN23_03485 [Verrucomicrobiae bacterium]|jgi:hypothetical protein
MESFLDKLIRKRIFCQKPYFYIFGGANLIGLVFIFAFIEGVREQAVLLPSEDFTDGLGLAFMVALACLAFLLSNVFWGVFALMAVLRYRNYIPAVACALMVALWVLEFLFSGLGSIFTG